MSQRAPQLKVTHFSKENLVKKIINMAYFATKDLYSAPFFFNVRRRLVYILISNLRERLSFVTEFKISYSYQWP